MSSIVTWQRQQLVTGQDLGFGVQGQQAQGSCSVVMSRSHNGGSQQCLFEDFPTGSRSVLQENWRNTVLLEKSPRSGPTGRLLS